MSELRPHLQGQGRLCPPLRPRSQNGPAIFERNRNSQIRNGDQKNRLGSQKNWFLCDKCEQG